MSEPVSAAESVAKVGRMVNCEFHKETQNAAALSRFGFVPNLVQEVRGCSGGTNGRKEQRVRRQKFRANWSSDDQFVVCTEYDASASDRGRTSQHTPT